MVVRPLGIVVGVPLLACASHSHAQLDRPDVTTLQPVEFSGITARPLRIARFNSITGEIGDWRNLTFTSRGTQCPGAPLYDAFPNPDTCGVAGQTFGSDYCATSTVADIDVTVNPALPQALLGGTITSFGVQLFFFGDDGQGPNPGHGANPGNLEQLWLIVETYEDFNTAGQPATGLLSSWILDYGTQTYTNAGYINFLAEICDIDMDGDGETRDEGWRIPADGSGAVVIHAASDLDDTNGDGLVDVITPSSCAQVVLYGTGNHQSPQEPSRPGDESPFEWRDTAPRDTQFTPNELVDTTPFSTCPAPLGAALRLQGNACNFPLANWDGNDVFDTADFLAYLNDYNAVAGGQPFTHDDPDLAPPTGGGASTLNTADFVAYLNAFGTCQS